MHTRMGSRERGKRQPLSKIRKDQKAILLSIQFRGGGVFGGMGTFSVERVGRG